MNNVASNNNDEELIAWLRLVLTPGIGIRTAHKLLTAFGMPQDIFSASYNALRKAVPEKLAEQLHAPASDDIKALSDKTLSWLSEQGNRLLTLADSRYPKKLLQIPDPPLMLYVKGRLDLLSADAIAIVGSRNATAQGCLDAENFANALGDTGLTTISGLALGIDAAAHRGGLKSQGSTIAVIGTGADIVYPARNHALAHQIADEGCIISEFPLGTSPIPSNFPRRNRIISGLADGILVVEAAAQSGSLITAKLALEQGRDVFAIPGSIHSPLSRGCHALIRQGAKLVETAEDILSELKRQVPVIGDTASEASKTEGLSLVSPLLADMGFDPVDMDTLCQRHGMDAATLSAELLNLELMGQVESLPGGFYRRLVP
ncbi:MAG: DNA-processing protein DprA [Oxalobacter sp.]|nr:DNA-processing protein DprA [Oxalobacter sp.]